ncbi:hypothetical protein EBL_c01890 [Shimwellia blattae DSM 4481 = NBRC 105725]|uniref:Uncharacterized protein n=1 Tax=Shimwellia blattae (strain ATCC 29907 / DSM 4481 / JCM 1650 / NBRC 105725 / CDC 9005-74) TaxID=630626 RepID=I2B470_SHIBC|nr:hypothetical protein EBL_c01890 [Shimwellia blattae DSM 4481 = NBRC 105725]
MILVQNVINEKNGGFINCFFTFLSAYYAGVLCCCPHFFLFI